MAAETAASPADAGFLWAIARLIIALVILVPLAYWVTRLYARRSLGHSGGRLRVLQATGIGGQRHVVVIAAGERRFLVGATPQEISLIAELNAEEWPLGSGDDPGVSRFARELADRFKRSDGKDETPS